MKIKAVESLRRLFSNRSAGVNEGAQGASMPMNILRASEKVSSIFSMYEHAVGNDGYNFGFYSTTDYAHPAEDYVVNPTAVQTLYYCAGKDFADYKLFEASGNSEQANRFRTHTDRVHIAIISENGAPVYHINSRLRGVDQPHISGNFDLVQKQLYHFATKINPNLAHHIVIIAGRWGQGGVVPDPNQPQAIQK